MEPPKKRSDESSKDIERERDEFRAILIGLLITATVGPFLYWLMGALQ